MAWKGECNVNCDFLLGIKGNLEEDEGETERKISKDLISILYQFFNPLINQIRKTRSELKKKEENPYQKSLTKQNVDAKISFDFDM